MGLQIERVPTLGDNYSYLIICSDTGESAVVDVPEAEPMLQRIEAVGANVTKVLSTHHHFDHSAANPELAKRFDAPVFGHASDSGRLPGLTDGLEEGDRVRVGSQEAEILFIPAHTRGHIAYFFPDSKAVFCGDTLFVAGCGRLFEGTPELMYTALVEKLGRLPDDTRVFCGHEYTESNLRFAVHAEPDNADVRRKLAEVEKVRAGAAPDWHDASPDEMTIPSTIGEEKRINPFMRAADAAALGRIRAEKDSF